MPKENNLPRILVVDDEPPIQRFLRTALDTGDFTLHQAETGHAALAAAAATRPDVILLDLGLPDMDGVEVIRRIREWSQVPIIVLSVRDREDDKVKALDAGADDYLTKPFGVGELLARIRAALRRTGAGEEGKTADIFTLDKLRVDFDRRQVFRDEEEIHLTPIEYKLLSVLIRHQGKVVTHRQLLKEVWGPSSVEQHPYLRIFILNLRRKLEDNPTRPHYLITEPGVGYRLRGE